MFETEKPISIGEKMLDKIISTENPKLAIQKPTPTIVIDSGDISVFRRIYYLLTNPFRYILLGKRIW